MGSFQKIVNFLVLLFRKILRWLKGQVRNYVRKIADPRDNNSYNIGSYNSNWSLSERDIEGLQTEHKFEKNVEYKSSFKEFERTWEISKWAILVDRELTNSKQDLEKDLDFRWNFFWYAFLQVHPPYLNKEIESQLELNSSTYIPNNFDMFEAIMAIGKEVFNCILLINLWKFLREELYSILNFGFEVNPASAYITHVCELSSVNNPNQKYAVEISDELDQSQMLQIKFEDIVKQKQDNLSIMIPTIFS